MRLIRHFSTSAPARSCGRRGDSPIGNRRLTQRPRISGPLSERGFTLIELVIGSAVFIIAMAAVVNVLQISQSLHAKTQQGLELEQNVRSALNLICRELVNAGSGVPYLTQLNGSPSILIPAQALLGPLGSATGATSIYFITPCHQAGGTVTKDGEGNDLTSPIATDMLVFLGGTGSSAFVNQDTPGPSANYGLDVYVTDSSLFSVGLVVLISNGFQVSLGQITDIITGGGLEFANGADPLRLNPGSTAETPNPNMDAAQQIAGGPPPQVFPLSAITYFIDSTANPAHPAIKRLANSDAGASGAVEVADDIENLQVAYLVDDDANATTPVVPMAAPSASQLPLIRGVTVSITGRSRQKMGDPAWPDGHSRITLSQTVFFRNNIRR